jgi:16S rRNA C967 or C1407 C5-methylase (RsmB/RsmF family)
MAHRANKRRSRQGMSRKNSENQGSLAFEDHFSAIYGNRWPALREALAQPMQPEDHLPGLVKPYFLDAASVRAAQELDVQPGDDVLDLCAAPGGKTLVLALALKGSGSLTSNDRSPDRRARLHRVIEDHLPAVWRANIRVTGHDATRWGLAQPGRYDRILLDAPCSSERHLIHSPKHLDLWTAHRTKSLAQQGLAMLCAAVDSLKPGGTLVFATCSISPTENQDVLERLRGKRKGQWELASMSLELPDEKKAGPLFRARLVKL